MRQDPPHIVGGIALKRCECPDPSIDHGANNCQHAAQYRIVRDGKKLSVCGNCTLSGDRHLGKVRAHVAKFDEQVNRAKARRDFAKLTRSKQ